MPRRDAKSAFNAVSSSLQIGLLFIETEVPIITILTSGNEELFSAARIAHKGGATAQYRGFFARLFNLRKRQRGRIHCERHASAN